MEHYTAEQKEDRRWGTVRQDTIQSWKTGLTYAEAKAIKDEFDEHLIRFPQSFCRVFIIRVIEV